MREKQACLTWQERFSDQQQGQRTYWHLPQRASSVQLYWPGATSVQAQAGGGCGEGDGEGGGAGVQRPHALSQYLAMKAWPHFPQPACCAQEYPPGGGTSMQVDAAGALVVAAEAPLERVGAARAASSATLGMLAPSRLDSETAGLLTPLPPSQGLYCAGRGGSQSHEMTAACWRRAPVGLHRSAVSALARTSVKKTSSAVVLAGMRHAICQPEVPSCLSFDGSFFRQQVPPAGAQARGCQAQHDQGVAALGSGGSGASHAGRMYPHQPTQRPGPSSRTRQDVVVGKGIA